MKQKLIAAFAVILATLSFSASAEDCVWSTTGLQFSTALTVNFACRDGSTVAATKQVTVSAKQTSCSVSATTGYENSGTCSSPEIVEEPECRTVTPIGGPCNNSWCSERFGRNCAAMGGTATYGPNHTCTVCE